MALVRRSPRKLIRLSQAAEILQVSRGTIRNLIYRDKKLVPIQPKPGTSSPIKLYQSQVEELAKSWGIF